MSLDQIKGNGLGIFNVLQCPVCSGLMAGSVWGEIWPEHKENIFVVSSLNFASIKVSIYYIEPYLGYKQLTMWLDLDHTHVFNSKQSTLHR